MNQSLKLSLFVLIFLVSISEGKIQETAASPPIRPGQPPFPIWPMSFTSKYDVLVPAYGNGFVHPGVVYYDYTIKRARAYYYDWCIPLFDDDNSSQSLSNIFGQGHNHLQMKNLKGKMSRSTFDALPNGMYNHTCSFLMTADGTYFISPDFPFIPNRCCWFGPIPPPTPDWVKNTQWNGTDTLRGSKCNVWWFPGTDDPSHPYYGYWSRIDAFNTPVRFLGLSSIGVTILDYTSHQIGPVPRELLVVPDNCNKECQAPPDNFFMSHKP